MLWYSLERDLGQTAINSVVIEAISANRRQIRLEYDNKIEAIIDCAWSHRRGADEATVTLIDARTKKVIAVEHILRNLDNGIVRPERNYNGSSKGMEGSGVEKILQVSLALFLQLYFTQAINSLCNSNSRRLDSKLSLIFMTKIVLQEPL